MRTIYVLGAGFSKSCGIATDPEMLRALNETLPRVQSKLKSEPRTSIEHLLEQAFKRRNVGFEQFMSTLSGLNPLGINFEYRITGLRSLMLLTTAVTMSLKMETDHSVKLVKSLRVRRKLRRSGEGGSILDDPQWVRLDDRYIVRFSMNGSRFWKALRVCGYGLGE
jgi:hypothetical protein